MLGLSFNNVHDDPTETTSSVIDMTCCYLFFREGEGVKRVKFLQRQLIEVRKEKEQELQQRNELIAHFKDQLQETKAKTNMEGGYHNISRSINTWETVSTI